VSGTRKALSTTEIALLATEILPAAAGTTVTGIYRSTSVIYIYTVNIATPTVPPANGMAEGTTEKSCANIGIAFGPGVTATR
jgi:hypothetical protein